MKFYIISGEASGDLHGSNLMLALRRKFSQVEFRCWGGDKMEAAGGTLVKHYSDLAFMGFKEVIQNLPEILGNIRLCKKDITAYRPDAIILVDYPGFNLRIAEWGKKNGYRIIYYISPQVWAWKENRVKMMKKCIDLMLVILPFEQKFFREKWNWDVDYVGHPLVEVIKAFDPKITDFSNKPVVALLPGSRKQEIRKHLSIMLEVAGRFPGHHFIVAMAPGQTKDFYSRFLKEHNNVSAVGGLTYDLLKASKAAIVTSGTATLETALLKVPEFVGYKTSNMSYQIARKLVKIKYISLVNLIMDKPVVKELIQQDFNASAMTNELSNLLNNPVRRHQMLNDYDELENVLSAGGHASDNAAEKIKDFLGKRP